MFPGELPEDPEVALRAGGFRGHGETGAMAIWAPLPALPAAEARARGTKRLPHIRLDRALQFLLGDRLG